MAEEAVAAVVDGGADAKVEEEVAPAIAPEDLPKLKLSVLMLVRMLQNGHGLRHKDYERYRKFCARRMRRLRVNTSFLHKRSRREYQTRALTAEAVMEERHLQLALINAERAWAAAMTVKSDNDVLSTKQRRWVLRRLQRAAQHAEQLQALAAVRADDTTALEAEAYAAWMGGVLQLEKDNWESALERFSRSLHIYTRLAEAYAGSSQERMFRARMEELAPNVRYCKYNLSLLEGDGDAALTELALQAADDDLLRSKLETVMSERREEKASSLSQVSWLGKTIAVQSGRIRDAILREEQLAAELSQLSAAAGSGGSGGDDEDDDDSSGGGDEGGVDKQEDLLVACVACWEDSLAALATQRRGLARDDALAAADLDVLQEYITYHKLRRTVQRNLLLVSRLRKQLQATAAASSAAAALSAAPSPASSAAAAATAADKRTAASLAVQLVRIYEKLVANEAELMALPTVAQDDALVSAATIARRLYDVNRLLWVARCYELDAQFAKAAKLYDAAEEAADELAGDDLTEDMENEVNALSKTLLARRTCCQAQQTVADNTVAADAAASAASAASADGSSSEVAAAAADGRPDLLRRQAVYDGSDATFVAKLPPAPRAIPPKPLLFDVAFEMLDFPDISKKAEKPAGGLFGWLSGR